MSKNIEEQTVTLEDAMNLAVGHMQNQNYRVAEMVLQDVLKSVEDHGEGHYLLALARYYMNNFDGALPHFEMAVKSDDANAEWWCNYGIILTQLGRYEEALKQFEDAIRFDENYPEIYWNMAHCHWLSGDYERAEKMARVGIEKNPETAEAWLNLGAALVKQDKPEEAKEAWEKATELNPEMVFAWNNLGNVSRDLGNLEEAIEYCEKALAIDPNYAEALNNIANAQMDLGMFEESEANYRKSVTAKPDYADAHNNLGINLVKQGRYYEAIQSCRVALSYRPEYFEALLCLSLAARSVGDLVEAEKAIHKATLIDPESAEARIDLADLLFMQDRYGDAEIELQRVQELKPDTVRAYLKLADVYERGGKVQEAIEAIDQALELNPDMPEVHTKKGAICHISNRIPEAEGYFEKALEIRPNMAAPLISLAEVNLSKGDMDKAEFYINKAKEVVPDLPSLYLTVSKTKKFTEDDPDFQKMVELADKGEKFGIDQLASLNYALFSAYENIGDSDKAFAHLLKASEYKRRLVPYDPDRQSQNFKNIKEFYSPDALKTYEGKGLQSDLPVFILGMPRSGTTLTEQIISSHSDVFGAGELVEMSIIDNFFGYLKPDNAKAQGQWYIDRIIERDENGLSKRITDKMPGNFSAIGKITAILPDAKIIHTRRNPIDTCLSCFKQNFARGQYWSYNLQELGQYYNLYLDLMAYWREHLGDRFIEIDYEDTVNDLEKQARHLIDYVELPWDEKCLKPHKQKRAVLTASKTQVTQPVYKTSVKSWQKYETQLQPLIDELSSGPAKELLDI